MEGFGRYYYCTGQRFEGTFVDGKRHGVGKIQKTDGCLEVYCYSEDIRCKGSWGVRWSPLRNKAWQISDKGRAMKKLSVEEALTLVYQLENTENAASFASASGAGVADANDVVGIDTGVFPSGEQA
jgi:hypothetical protein